IASVSVLPFRSGFCERSCMQARDDASAGYAGAPPPGAGDEPPLPHAVASNVMAPAAARSAAGRSRRLSMAEEFLRVVAWIENPLVGPAHCRSRENVESDGRYSVYAAETRPRLPETSIGRKVANAAFGPPCGPRRPPWFLPIRRRARSAA